MKKTTSLMILITLIIVGCAELVRLEHGTYLIKFDHKYPPSFTGTVEIIYGKVVKGEGRSYWKGDILDRTLNKGNPDLVKGRLPKGAYVGFKSYKALGKIQIQGVDHYIVKDDDLYSEYEPISQEP